MAASKKAAVTCVEGHFEDPGQQVWTRNLRMIPDGSPPAALVAMADSDLLDPDRPGCWVWLAMFHGHRVAELTADGVRGVGEFRLDRDTGTFTVAPIGG